MGTREERLLLARRARQHDVTLGGGERALLCTHRRPASARARRALSQLRHVLRGRRRPHLVLRRASAQHLLVQRRLRRLSPKLQLGDGGDAGARAETAGPPPRLELGGAGGRLRPEARWPSHLRHGPERGALPWFSARDTDGGGAPGPPPPPPTPPARP